MNPEDKNLCGLCERWLDGDLPDPLLEKFCKHLSECPTCSHQIEACQYLDLEIEAACRLFAVGSNAVGAEDVTVCKQVATVSNRRKLIRQSHLVAAMVTAASVLAISWFAWPTPKQKIPGNDSELGEKNHSIAKSSASTTPAVHIQFKETALAEPAISTRHFTFVRVFALSSDTTPSGDSNSREFQ